MREMDRTTKLSRVKEVRDHALRLLKAHGEWKGSGDQKHLGAKIGNVSLSYRTPFQPLPEISEQLRYMQALLKGKDNLPYGMDVWSNRKKVLNLEWADDGEVDVISYKPGEWESALNQAAEENGGGRA
jgi:hypothetical protein